MPSDRVSYEQLWRSGRVRVETNSIERLKEMVDELKDSGTVEQRPNDESLRRGKDPADHYPVIPGNSGCTDAIRQLLGSEWGTTEARTERELTGAMRSNGIRFSHGTISGSLTAMTRKNELQRPGKKNGSYCYLLNPDKIQS
jgi:hypothetical protein